jgi:putative colanic acid biosynthesis UDP-glucose lipid carrier transferase
MISQENILGNESTTQPVTTYTCKKNRQSFFFAGEKSNYILTFKHLFIKRIFDIFCSLFMLVFVFPILLIVITIINLFSSHFYPIFFIQKRTGLNGKTFLCYKFRTMKVNTLANQKQASSNDPRITKFGQYLRQTSLDEIPQFFNVLMGDMSVVGPRPHMLRHTVEYATLIPDYMLRHCVRPGITGWAQIEGFRGETKKMHQMEGRIKRDLWYIENYSFWLDLKIIILTPIRMICKV